MSESNPTSKDCPESPAVLRQQLHEEVDRIADFCETFEGRFFPFEKQLQERLWALGRLLVALFLLARHLHGQRSAQDHSGFRFSECLPRTLRTVFGEVRYRRDYWIRKKGKGGFHPLDAELGLTSDGFSPWVMSLACRLTTYLTKIAPVRFFFRIESIITDNPGVNEPRISRISQMKWSGVAPALVATTA